MHHSNNSEVGGCGGGLIGGSGTALGGSTSVNYNQSETVSFGGTQTTAPKWSSNDNRSDTPTQGGFGYACQIINTNESSYGCGGGGGWYGGSKGIGDGGAGGSSFISGHPGCNGVNSSGTHLGASEPSTIKIDGVETTVSFISGTTQMIDGDGYLWNSASISRVYQDYNNPDLPKIGSTTAQKATIPTKPTQSNNNNGFCRITYTP